MNPALLAAWTRLHPARPAIPLAPPEYLTSRQLAALWGVSHGAARTRIRKLFFAGQLERGLRPLRTGGLQFAYKIKE